MMNNLIIGSHVGFNKNEQLIASVKEAISYNSNTFMFYTGAPQNTLRMPIDDIKTMDALNIPKEKIPKILTKLKEKTDEENMVNYILNKFNNNEPILDDTELDTIVRNFLEAVNIKATQSNSSLKDYLPEYLSNLKIS